MIVIHQFFKQKYVTECADSSIERPNAVDYEMPVSLV